MCVPQVAERRSASTHSLRKKVDTRHGHTHCLPDSCKSIDSAFQRILAGRAAAQAGMTSCSAHRATAYLDEAGLVWDIGDVHAHEEESALHEQGVHMAAHLHHACALARGRIPDSHCLVLRTGEYLRHAQGYAAETVGARMQCSPFPEQRVRVAPTTETTLVHLLVAASPACNVSWFVPVHT